MSSEGETERAGGQGGDHSFKVVYESANKMRFRIREMFLDCRKLI